MPCKTFCHNLPHLFHFAKRIIGLGRITKIGKIPSPILRFFFYTLRAINFFVYLYYYLACVPLSLCHSFVGKKQNFMNIIYAAF